MKFFLLILLSVNIFASSISSIQSNFEILNKEIDKIAVNLTPEEKLSLYYLVLSTHEKITTALTMDDKNIEQIDKLQQSTLSAFSKLHEHNENIKTQDI